MIREEEVCKMLKIKYLKTILAVLCCSVLLTGSDFCAEKVTAETTPVVAASGNLREDLVSPLKVVRTPKLYLNTKIKMKAKFDKFATLGLDYKPAFKSSENYISFLIKRDDVAHDIPLSEMKLFMKRDEAQKHIDLKTDDEVLIIGTVFSDALGDAWVDVEELTLLSKAPDKEDEGR